MIGINMTTPGVALDVTGQINASADICLNDGTCLSSVGSGDITAVNIGGNTCTSGDCDLTTQDGSGSGLDADLLDGIEASAFMDIKTATANGTIGWNRIAEITGSNGRGGGVVILTDDGGTGQPTYQMFRVSKDWGSEGVISLLHSTTSTYISQVRLVYNSTLGEMYFDAYLTSANVSPQVTVYNDQTDVGSQLDAVAFTNATNADGTTIATLNLTSHIVFGVSSEDANNILNAEKDGDVFINKSLYVGTRTGNKRVNIGGNTFD